MPLNIKDKLKITSIIEFKWIWRNKKIALKEQLKKFEITQFYFLYNNYIFINFPGKSLLAIDKLKLSILVPLEISSSTTVW